MTVFAAEQWARYNPRMSENPKRRLRFSLRTMLVLVAILSVPMAWVAYCKNWIRERHAVLENSDLLLLPFPSLPGRWAGNPIRLRRAAYGCSESSERR